MPMFTDTPTPTTVVRPEVAEHHVEVGAAHGPEAVEAGQHHVGRLDPDLGQTSTASEPGVQLRRRPWRRRRTGGRCGSTPAVGAPGGDAVDDVDPCGAGPGHQPTGRLEHPGGPGPRSASSGNARLLAEHADLALLGHHDRVPRIDQRPQAPPPRPGS